MGGMYFVLYRGDKRIKGYYDTEARSIVNCSAKLIKAEKEFVKESLNNKDYEIINNERIIYSPMNYQEAVFNKENLSLLERRTIIIVPNNYNEDHSVTDIPYYSISKAKQLFKFPPNHPIANVAYAMIDVFPDSYIQFNEFHEYYKQTKHAAFIELCASLGAKEICIERVEINNQLFDVDGDINGPLASLGLGIRVKKNIETGEKIAFRFSEENEGIKEYDSPWLHTEPSWRSMYSLRKNNHLKEAGAEFSCVSDMGINTNLASKIMDIGINLGGNFIEMIKINLSYAVTFW